jgi:ubiquitin C-terminal hydrolase
VLETKCDRCKKNISLKEKTTIIKLPEILIFTLKRFGLNNNSINKIKIILDDEIEMGDYLDINNKENRTKYKLFAINIRKGENNNYGCQICIIKRANEWYEIGMNYKKVIKNFCYNDYSDGLFYRRC